MTRILAFLLFILAIIVGLALPEFLLNRKDRSLGKVQSPDLSEPRLHWNGDKSTPRSTAITGEAFARKLEMFGVGPTFLLPQNTPSSTDSSWVYDHAVSFLNLFFEVESEVTWYIIEYRYAWFESGTTVPIWSIELILNEMWHCSIDMDEASGIILRCSIHSDGLPWEEFFPDSFANSNYNKSNDTFPDLISFRFCEALNTLYGMSMGKSMDVSASPVINQCAIRISITDQSQTTSVTSSLQIYPDEPITYNYSPVISEDEVAE